ncbi:type 1 fimbrial protein [Enterobacter cancerogenus]|uniref:fimbrial protein n=1 Tax=Enterobacter cancerogenus TaxID=69218 RepID=UPI000C9BB556|nr:fimbrial protein [Enterobacter cancerogenus]PNF13478.1 type 1 fimbrial protein [Enterobacter cancerogenus]
MKINVFVSLVITSIVFIHAAWADTTIEYSGTLIADPCVVDTDSEDQTVDFGTVVKKTFINHTRSVAEPFRIRLLECDLTAGNNVAVTFNGTESSDHSETFAVTGEAKGITIALEDSDGNAVKPARPMKPVPLTGEETILDYRAYVQSSDYSNVREGAFESVVSFMLEYD